MWRTSWGAGLAFVACAGPQQQITTEPSTPTRPTWLAALPKEPGQAFVIGVKSRAPTLEDGKRGAQESATVQASSLVGTTIKSRAQSHESTDGPTSASADVEAATRAVIENLQTVDEYWEKTTKTVGSYYEVAYDVWILAKLPLDAAQKERARQAKEQQEQLRDAYQRYRGAQADLARKVVRTAWLQLQRASAIVAALPPLTEMPEPGEAEGEVLRTAADLGRVLDPVVREVNERAYGVQVDLSKVGAIDVVLRNALAAALPATALRLRDGDARFALTITATSETPNKKVMGQQVAYLTYTAVLNDTWSGAALDGGSGEAKGFGKAKDGALQEAAAEAAKAIAAAAGRAAQTALEAERAGGEM